LIHGIVDEWDGEALGQGEIAVRVTPGKGARTGFEELLVGQYPTVYDLCFRMTHNAHDAEDLVQQAFLQALRHFPRFRSVIPVRPWLLRIARNLCVSHLRRRRFQTYLEDLPATGPASNIIAPEEAALAREMHERLAAALSQLPAELKRVIALRYQCQLSYEEIASVIDKPLWTVKNRLFKAHRRLGLELGRGADD
jgi:RNA polymerase sigma-70 factor (ECF subfamily)